MSSPKLKRTISPAAETEREMVRRDGGQFGYNLDAMCVCGHTKGEHVFPSGRQCLAEIEGSDDGCPCPGFRKSRKKAPKSRPPS